MWNQPTNHPSMYWNCTFQTSWMWADGNATLLLAQRKKDEERRSRRRRPGSSSIALSLSMVSPSLRIPAAARVFDPAINTRCPPPHAVVMRMRSRSRRSIAASASPPGDPSIRDPISLPSKEPPACASASFSLLFGHSPRSPPGPLTSADLMEASGDGLKVAYQVALSPPPPPSFNPINYSNNPSSSSSSCYFRDARVPTVRPPPRRRTRVATPCPANTSRPPFRFAAIIIIP